MSTPTDRKTAIVSPGTYGVIPKAVRARRDLTDSAKLVYCALLDHLRPGNGQTMVYPSIGRLADLTGRGRTATREALIDLATAGLIVTHGAAGQVSRYEMTGPQSDPHPAGIRPGTQPESDQVPNRIPTHTQPESDPVPSRNPTHTQPESDPEVLKELLEEEKPPLPPTGGKQETLPQDQDQQPRRPRRPEDPALAARLTEIGQAWREVHGPDHDLPTAWRRALAREWTDGDRALVEAIDTAALRAAQTYRRDKKLEIFAPGTVFLYLADQARQAAERETRHAERFKAERARQAADAARVQAVAEAAEAAEKLRAWFATLPLAQQQRHIAQAETEPFTQPDRRDLITHRAAKLAQAEQAASPSQKTQRSTAHA